MATKSFEKNIVVNNKKDAQRFIAALENACGRRGKKVIFNEPVEYISDHKAIRKIFGE